jgi:hypothetical protein
LFQNREQSEPLEKWVIELGEGVHDGEVSGDDFVSKALNTMG